MHLDCNTTRGRVFISHQQTCIKRVCGYMKCDAIWTPDTDIADVDALFSRDSTLVAVSEVKCRGCTIEQLRKWGSYLITNNKLTRLRAVAKSLTVPGFLMVYLIDSDMVVYWHICKSDGSMCLPVTCDRTATQATCNGGLAHRMNAFLPLTHMRMLAMPVAPAKP